MASELLLRALKRQARFSVTVCPQGAEIADIASSSNPDIALVHVDSKEAGRSGLDCLRQLRAQAPATRCIVLLSSPDKQVAIDAFRAGARGVFCPSQSDFKMLCRCIDRVFAGQIWIRNSELEHLIEALAQCAPARLLRRPEIQLLSNREKQVVNLLAEGLTNREIARELSLSEHTVKNYLFKIFDKVEVSSRVELVLFAMQCADQLEVPAAAAQPQPEQLSA
ncbi:MAG: response regulator transcription factor [Candidatus Korobacteraceae bacterium]